MRGIKRVVSLLVAVVMVLAMIPSVISKVSAATTMTQSSFAKKLLAFETNVYSHGEKYANNNSSTLGWQCFGYANYLARYIYGSFPTAYSSGRILNKNWEISRGASSIDDLHVGDIVRYRYKNSYYVNHSIFITGIDGDTVYYTDANSNGINTVKWNQKTTKTELKNNVKKYLNDQNGKLTSFLGFVAHYQYWDDISTLTINYSVNGGSVADSNLYEVATGGYGLKLRESASTSSTSLVLFDDGTVLEIMETKVAGGYTWGKVENKVYEGKTYSGWCALNEVGVEDYTIKPYYLSSDKIYKTASKTPVSTTWAYSEGDAENGLYNAETFGLTRQGYTFGGWCLRADGSGTVFGQDDKTLKAETICPAVANGNQTVTLYAVWIPLFTNSFAFDANGGSGTVESLSAKAGEKITLPNDPFTRDGYSFVGWNVKRDNDDKWYVVGEGWKTDAEILANKLNKKLYRNAMSLTIDSSWFGSLANEEASSYTFYAVWQDASISDVFVAETGAKAVYYVNDTIDASKIVLTVKKQDGSLETITEGFECSPQVLTAEGVQTVTVTYKEHQATFEVLVTKNKAANITVKATANNVCYYLPSTDAKSFNPAAYSGDTCVILCAEGDYYLGFFPFNASTATKANGFLGYMQKSTFSQPSATVPSSTDYYTLNPTGEYNAIAKTEAKVYHRPATTTITGTGNTDYTSYESLKANQAVKVLFAMDDYYCVQTANSTGFVAKSAIELNKVVTGITASTTESVVALGSEIDVSQISAAAQYSDGTSAVIDLSDAKIVKPSTQNAGQKGILVSYGGYTTVITIVVEEPEMTGIKITQLPFNTQYSVGSVFDATGLKVSACYDNGSQAEITNIDVSYDFSATGETQVLVQYGEFSTVIPVTVYNAPLVQINSVFGYPGEIVSVPVTYYGEDVEAYSLYASISYDSANLQYKGFTVGEGLDATRFYINASQEDVLLISAAKDEKIASDCVLFELKFVVIGEKTNVDTEDEYLVRYTSFALYGENGTEYDVVKYNGYVNNLGEVEIQFEANGGENAPNSQIVPYGTVITIATNVPTKQDYVFLGWATDYNSNYVQYLPGDTLEARESQTLFAVWEKETDEDQTTFAELLNAAQAGDTITLDADRQMDTIILKSGVTIDLNGHTLTADFVAVRKDGCILDSSSAGTGKLATTKEGLAIFEDNEGVLSLWDEEKQCYIFSALTYQQMVRTAADKASASYIFIPYFSNPRAMELLKDGGTDNGLSVRVKMSWNGGMSEQYYTFTDSLVSQVYGSVTNGVAQSVFMLTITGISGITDMEVSAAIEADTGCNSSNLKSSI